MASAAAALVLCVAAGFLPLRSDACSPPVVDGKPVRVASLSYLAAFAYGIAQIELEENVTPSAPTSKARGRARVHRWMKQKGPDVITVSGFDLSCPTHESQSPFRRGGRLIVFMSPPGSDMAYALIERGGDINNWVWSNALGDDPETASEIASALKTKMTASNRRYMDSSREERGTP